MTPSEPLYKGGEFLYPEYQTNQSISIESILHQKLFYLDFFNHR